MAERPFTRADWIGAAIGMTVTAVILAAFFLAAGLPYPWLGVLVAVVAYPLAGWVLNKAMDWHLARRGGEPR